jgi:hypothetical protein
MTLLANGTTQLKKRQQQRDSRMNLVARREMDTSQAMRAARWSVFGLATSGSVAWVILLDRLSAGIWSHHPVSCAVGLAPVAAMLVLTLTPRCISRTKSLVAFCACGISVLVMLVPWTPRKQFVRDLFSLQVGMSLAEVEVIMAGYIRGAGARWELPHGFDPLVCDPDQPDAGVSTPQSALNAYREHHSGRVEAMPANWTMIYRWSTHPRYNADWGQVKFVNGKVADVSFRPD